MIKHASPDNMLTLTLSQLIHTLIMTKNGFRFA